MSYRQFVLVHLVGWAFFGGASSFLFNSGWVAYFWTIAVMWAGQHLFPFPRLHP